MTIVGTLASPCLEVQKPIQIKRVGDVFVALPLQKANDAVECKDEKRGFKEVVSLGVLPPGDYLFHVRSRNGRSVSRTFTVMALASHD
jgi:hypothetical protein